MALTKTTVNQFVQWLRRGFIDALGITIPGVVIVDADGNQIVPFGASNSLVAGEAHIGEVGTSDAEVSLTPTLDTNIYAAGDVFFVATELASVGRIAAGHVILTSIKAIDIDDQGPELTLQFWTSAVTIGTINAAPSINDTDILQYLGEITIPAYKWTDMGGCKVATLLLGDTALGMKLAAASTSVWVSALTGTISTQSASGMKFLFYFMRA